MSCGSPYLMRSSFSYLSLPINSVQSPWPGSAPIGVKNSTIRTRWVYLVAEELEELAGVGSFCSSDSMQSISLSEASTIQEHLSEDRTYVRSSSEVQQCCSDAPRTTVFEPSSTLPVCANSSRGTQTINSFLLYSSIVELISTRLLESMGPYLDILPSALSSFIGA